MEENTVPNYCLTKTNGGKTKQQLQTNSPKFLSKPRNAPKTTPFKIK